jgi:BON domain
MFCTNCGSKLDELHLQRPRSAPQISQASAGTAATPRLVPSQQSSQASAVAQAENSVQTTDRSAPADDLRPSTVARPSQSSSISPVVLWGGIVLFVAAVAVAALMLYRFSSSARPLSDKEIVQTLQAKFAADPTLSKCTLKPFSEKGVVTLVGLVNTDADKAKATSMAAQLRGVSQVNIYGLVVNGQPAADSQPTGGGGQSTKSGTERGNIKKVDVLGSQPWTQTGIYLQRGDVVIVSASGGISFSASSAPTGPAGDLPDCYTVANGPYGWRALPYVANQLPCTSLLGKVGENGTIFYIGAETAFRAATTGQFLLGVNDNNFGDNSGSWTAIVKVSTNPLVPGSADAGWLGFANATSPQDREAELRSNCGNFARVYVPESVGNMFANLCNYQGKACDEICDWQGQRFDCSATSLGGARDGTRVVLCR